MKIKTFYILIAGMILAGAVLFGVKGLQSKQLGPKIDGRHVYVWLENLEPDSEKAVELSQSLDFLKDDVFSYLMACLELEKNGVFQKIPLEQLKPRVVWLLGSVDDPSPQLVTAIGKALSHPTEEIRRQAVNACVSYGARAIPLMNDLRSVALSDQNEQLRLLAIKSIGVLAEQSSDALNALLKSGSDPSPQIRLAVIEMLSGNFSDVSSVQGFLVTALKDKSPDVRKIAIKALIAAGTDQPGVVESLAIALEDSDPSVRSEAATALESLGVDAAGAYKQLTKALYDERPDVRNKAVSTIGKIGPQAFSSIPDLIRILEQNDDNSLFAAISLGKMGPPAKDAVPHLIRFFQNSDTSGKVIAAQALAGMKTASSNAVPVLTEALKSPDSAVQFAARFALDQIQGIPSLETERNQ
ncbi:MAG TPA: HEAT repeat domain-containing protein [Verrucomicrobia bacterium]|nr:HEAT repeat domain-containing protein [Verrucomicrobiota bacterium]